MRLHGADTVRNVACRVQGSSAGMIDLFKRLGPGFVTGASDDDPAGIGTYVQAGAQFGYAQLWTALFTFPVMATVQEMCGRIGRVTGKGLSVVIREFYPPWFLYAVVTLQVVANTINIGADLSAMAQSVQLLVHAPYLAMLLAVTSITTALIVLVPYRTYVTYLKFLGFTLLAYVVTAFFVHADWRVVAISTIVPHVELTKDFLLTLIAVFGVTISTYEFFWQASEEVEELIDEGKIPREGTHPKRSDPKAVRAVRNDTVFGMFFSNLITFFVIVVAAATLHAHGRTNVQTASDAARMLLPLAGPLAFGLFAAGIVSSGLLSIPVMAGSSAYAVGGALNWPRSLARPFWQQWRFYGVIVASCAIGIAVNLTHIPPFTLLFYSGVLSGVISPPMLFAVTQISSSRRIMGKYVNNRFSATMGWLLCGFMAVCVVALLVLSR
jgi:NRAMP (natural resistance-associated macrophage protein)-like metal ion transporter